jgi:hypothetical protein
MTDSKLPDLPSPCTSVCEMNNETGFCKGCYRTLDEIARWQGFTPEEKMAVLENLRARRGGRPRPRKGRLWR